MKARRERWLDDPELAESLEREVAKAESAAYRAGIDMIHHHSWCHNPGCWGCLSERW